MKLKALGFASIIMATTSIQAAPIYNITDLSTIVGGGSNGQIKINDSEQIVLSAQIDYKSKWYIGDVNNGLQELSIADWEIRNVTDINNNGQFVGNARNQSTGYRAFVGDSNGITIINSQPEHAQNELLGINNSGQTTGRADIMVQGNEEMYEENNQAYIAETDNIIKPFGKLNGRYVRAERHQAINDSGQAVGTAKSWVDDSSTLVAWIADENGMQQLDSLGGASQANDINNNGKIVGLSHLADVVDEDGQIIEDGYNHAFIGDINGITDIGTLDGASSSSAFAINELDQVVGDSYVGGANYAYNAFLFADEQMFNLNDLVTDLSGWEYLETAYDINNSGSIVGRGMTTNGERHAFLLTLNDGQPVEVPEPAMFAIFGLLLAGISFSRKQKK